MLTDNISQKIISDLGFEPTQSQISTSQKLSEFLITDNFNPVLLINGFAGTGKTSLMRSFCNIAAEMEFPLELMAPTGRAAKVLGNITGRRAYTIHKKIYKQDSADDFDSSFSINYNRQKATIFIVDESSMISNTQSGETEFGSGRLLDDLIAYVFSRPFCKLLLIGDSAQLPPIGFEEAPAMNVDKLSGYNITLETAIMTDVVRQHQESCILTNANNIREMINSGVADFDSFLLTTDGNEVERVSGAELIETLITSYDKCGTGNTLVITRSNKRANRFNQGIRSAVMFKEEEITRGDLLMVGKNNYYWLKDEKNKDFIANGDIAEIIRINGYQEMHGFRFADLSLCFTEHDNIETDAKILLDNLNSDTAKISREEEQQLYMSVMQDYADESPRKRAEGIRNDKWYNALSVKFAYAITCHKAQGGQWDTVFVDLGYFTPEMFNIEMLKWLYTAITRATKKLYFVNFDDKFFDKTSV